MVYKPDSIAMSIFLNLMLGVSAKDSMIALDKFLELKKCQYLKPSIYRSLSNSIQQYQKVHRCTAYCSDEVFVEMFPKMRIEYEFKTEIKSDIQYIVDKKYPLGISIEYDYHRLTATSELALRQLEKRLLANVPLI
jgi:uncharacterized lipoprotein YddW (UPF0748 family)